MIGLIKSEFRKISSTRMTPILVVSSLLLTATYVAMYALLAGFDNGTGQTLPPLTVRASMRPIAHDVRHGMATPAPVLTAARCCRPCPPIEVNHPPA